jgi:hypothetical protein
LNEIALHFGHGAAVSAGTSRVEAMVRRLQGAPGQLMEAMGKTEKK